MISLETRINAMIPYFLLGPLILFAKKGTPLADSYVQNHAKRATLVMVIGIISYIAYLFLRPIIAFSFFGIYGPTLILGIIETILLGVLLLGMYQAYRGIAVENVFQWKNLDFKSQIKKQDYSEEQKIRIVASFIPFVGIFLAEKYNDIEIKIGAKMANFGLVCFLLTQIFAGGTINSASFLISILYILFFTANAVYIFGFSSFFQTSFYNFVPTYHQIEAHIRASIQYVGEFLRVAFGKTKTFSYTKKYTEILQHISTKNTLSQKYWTNPRIIGIPFINLIALPSLKNPQHKEYKGAIFEGIFLSILFALEIYFYGVSHPYFWILFIPALTIIARIPFQSNIHAPITSFVLPISQWGAQQKTHIQATQSSKKGERFVYNSPEIQAQKPQ